MENMSSIVMFLMISLEEMGVDHVSAWRAYSTASMLELTCGMLYTAFWVETLTGMKNSTHALLSWDLAVGDASVWLVM